MVTITPGRFMGISHRVDADLDRQDGRLAMKCL